MKAPTRDELIGDLWGGLASMLVALPSSLAFGVAIYSALGPGASAQGAMAGFLGAAAIGILAPLLGGTDRLVSGPCAPAAAVMGGLAATLPPEKALFILMMVALLSGLLQVLYGAVGGGTLIKYVPYPVVTGYLSGVGVVIFLKQMPVLFGYPHGTAMWTGVLHPSLWQGPGVAVGLVTITVMLAAPRFTKAVPAAILGLAAGVAAYFGLALSYTSLLQLEGNPMIIGPLSASGSFLGALQGRWAALGGAHLSDLKSILVPALTLSALLSIDTLKTCVVVDSLTRTRHRSNKELIGQGLSNVASALIGGVPGAGVSGNTLVNLASGGRTRLSGVIEGVLVLAAFFFLGRLVAWTPVAALAGILVVVAYRMFDKNSFKLLRQRSTWLDFLVVATVIVVAVTVDLIIASGVGIALAILLFIRDQIRGSVIRRKVYGNQVFSKQRRLPEEAAILEKKGAQTVVCELQGNLFFGTTDQLITELDADLKVRRFVILDLRRVQALDFTAVHLLEQMEAQLVERGAKLLFADIPTSLPTGRDLRAYFDEVGLVKSDGHIQLFNELSDALEWAEDRILAEEGGRVGSEEAPLALQDIEFLKGRKAATLQELAACVVEKSYTAGERIFKQGEEGDELFLVRRGLVKIMLKLGEGKEHHLATIGRGDFFGDMSFLDKGKRSADAVAAVPTDIFILSRARFDAVADEHPRLGQQVFAGLARAQSSRLRHTDAELRTLAES